MKEECKIPYEIIAGRLERALQADVGMAGLKTMLYGWRKHPRFHAPAASALSMRATAVSEGYLTETELLDFSAYVQYDLTK